jgi:tRNA A-37 threonylcarbamoyl transferase component Bud32
VTVLSEALAPWFDRGEPFAWPDLTEVKSSTVRTVSRGSLAGIDVHLKLYRAVRLSDRARDALSGARGVKEFQNLREARRRGLPAVEPLAAGRFTGTFGARSFLITRTLPDGIPLERGPLPAEQAIAAGRLLRRAHDVGLRALDLHPGNVLVTPDGALHLLDLHSAVLTEPVDDVERARSLAYFCLGLDGGARARAAAPLLAGYGASAPLIDKTGRIGRTQRNHALAAFGRRATRDCRQTAVLRLDDGAIRSERKDVDPSLRAAAATFVARDRPAPRKSGRRGAVWLTETLAIKQRPAAAAERLFRASFWLEFCGVPTPQPVALHRYRGQGFVATARVHAPDLSAELQAGTLSTDDLVRAARSLGRSVGRLHAHGLRNRDLKFDNLIRDPADGSVLIADLDGVRRKTPLDHRGRAADLGRALAAWDDGHRGDRGEHALVVRVFWAAYHRALRCLQTTSKQDLRRRSEARAREWRQSHPEAPAVDVGS